MRTRTPDRGQWLCRPQDKAAGGLPGKVALEQPGLHTPRPPVPGVGWVGRGQPGRPAIGSCLTISCGSKRGLLRGGQSGPLLQCAILLENRVNEIFIGGFGVTGRVSGATACLSWWPAPWAKAAGSGSDPEPPPGPAAAASQHKGRVCWGPGLSCGLPESTRHPERGESTRTEDAGHTRAHLSAWFWPPEASCFLSRSKGSWSAMNDKCIPGSPACSRAQVGKSLGGRITRHSPVSPSLIY